MRAFVRVYLAVILVLGSGTLFVSARMDDVGLVRVPDRGIQPEIAVDRAGVVHMVYLAGAPASADVFYVRSVNGGATFSNPVRVNSQAGSAIATGTIRGAQIAIGRNGRLHVAWNGSGDAVPKPPVNPKTNRAGMPMLYARSNDGATAFEPQRNLITRTTNLDGGGSIAADESGVYVVWHGQGAAGEGGEGSRRVWIARSADEGATFERETPVSDPATGVCGCCALRLAAGDRGELHLLYRSATETVHRDIYYLLSHDRGRTFGGGRVHGWDVGACPMTSMSLVATGTRVRRAWETDGQVYFDSSDAADRPTSPSGTPSESARRHHPRLAVAPDGRVLLAWTEGTAWARGGSLAWQVFAPDGRPLAPRGTQPGVPVWSFAAAAAQPDGRFVIFY